MQPPEVVTVDFETYPIKQRPAYPPRPVGVAIAAPWAAPQYITDEAKAREALGRTWDSGLPVLCHYAKFDLAVCYEGMGLPRLPWERVHDTVFLAYLYDPHARSLGLKPLAADILKWPAEERNELDDWIWKNRAELERQYGEKVSKKSLGAWIWAAPVGITAPYAIGDVKRTSALFTHLWPIIQNEGMGRAYDRERQLLPILMENEELGMRVAVDNLNRDNDAYTQHFLRVEDYLRKELQAPGLNFDADQDVAAVLLSRGVVPKENWSLTAATKAHPQGQLSMSKETLTPTMFSGPNGAAIASALGYRNRLKTCLSMFMRPWLEQAQQYNGRITTNWNQVRNGGDSDGRGGGTRTGRPSTDKHNFLNISKAWAGRNDGYVHPAFLDVLPLPLCRKYILPDEGHVWLHRDFNGQEMRVFGHFEQGDLWRQYQANPRLDPHEWVRQVILDTTGTELIRTKVKNTNFARLYGGGKGAVYRRAQCSSEREAEEIMKFCDRALPGRELLNKEIRRVVRDPRFKAIRTWGGRLYYPEKPTLDKKTGRMMNWEYKLINYLVQGSAADGTKESIIDWYPHRGASRFLVTVYDENNISAPREDAVRAMRELKSAMEEPRLTVPMLTDPKHGETWGSIALCPPERKCELCL